MSQFKVSLVNILFMYLKGRLMAAFRQEIGCNLRLKKKMSKLLIKAKKKKNFNLLKYYSRKEELNKTLF